MLHRLTHDISGAAQVQGGNWWPLVKGWRARRAPRKQRLEPRALSPRKASGPRAALLLRGLQELTAWPRARTPLQGFTKQHV